MSTTISKRYAGDQPDLLSDDEWSERRYAAAKDHLHVVVTNELDDDAPLDVRANLVSYAARRAAQLVAQNGVEPPGPAAQRLLDALAAVDQGRPRDQPALKRVPPLVRAQAVLASKIAADPSMVDTLHPEMVAALDAVLGLVADDRRPALASYLAAVDEAREALAQACEARLRWIAVEDRRAVGAPTRAEAAAMAEHRALNGEVLA